VKDLAPKQDQTEVIHIKKSSDEKQLY